MAKRRPIATQEDTSKLIPKCITCGSWNTLAEATLLKLTMPKKAETTYPATIPIRMEASFTIPLPKWFNTVTMTSVKIATAQFCQEP